MKRWLVVLLLVVGARPVLADDDEPLYTCKVATGKLRAYFKPETELKDVVTWVMGFSCKTIVVGAGVDMSTKVTILAPNAMTTKQAMKLFVDAVDAAGFVVQDKGDDLVIKLAPGATKPCSGAPATMSGVPATAEAVAPETDIDAVLAGIKRLDDTHVEVSAKLIDAVRANPMGFAKGARVVPALKDGKAAGFKVYVIRPSSLYARIGLQNGDTLQTVNGLELTSADKALEAYATLRDAKTIALGIERRGKPLTIMITVK
jgi:general secretion pathway protein C